MRLLYFFLLVPVFIIFLGFFYILANLHIYQPYFDYFYLFGLFLFSIICFMLYLGSDLQLNMKKKRKPRGVYDPSGLFRVYKGYFKVEYYYLGVDPITKELLPIELKKHPEDSQKFIIERIQTTGNYMQMYPYYAYVLFLCILMLACVAYIIRFMIGASWRDLLGG